MVTDSVCRVIIECIKDVCQFPSEAEAERIIDGLRWMGILVDDKATVANGTPLDTLCARLEPLMSFKPGERDLVMLQHKFIVEWPDKKQVKSQAFYRPSPRD